MSAPPPAQTLHSCVCSKFPEGGHIKIHSNTSIYLHEQINDNDAQFRYPFNTSDYRTSHKHILFDDVLLCFPHPIRLYFHVCIYTICTDTYMQRQRKSITHPEKKSRFINKVSNNIEHVWFMLSLRQLQCKNMHFSCQKLRSHICIALSIINTFLTKATPCVCNASWARLYLQKTKAMATFSD